MHYRGKNVKVLFNSVDVSGDGRAVNLEESADTLDDTVYGADRRTKLASLEDGSGSLEALDITGAWSSAWNEFAVGSTATMQVRPEGDGVGLREISFTAIITKRSLALPYDDLSTLSVDFEISGVPVEDVQAV